MFFSGTVRLNRIGWHTLTLSGAMPTGFLRAFLIFRKQMSGDFPRYKRHGH